MSSWKHALGGVAAFGLLALVPAVSGAASLRDGVDSAPASRLSASSFTAMGRAGMFLLLLSAKLLVVLPALYDGQ